MADKKIFVSYDYDNDNDNDNDTALPPPAFSLGR
jgi:hypothetical protein